MLDKSAQREWIRYQLSGLSTEEKAARATQLAQLLANHPMVKYACYCLVYWELEDEIALSPWFLAEGEHRQQFLLPKVQGEDLVVCPLLPEVQVGAYGIMEPMQAHYSREDLLQLRDWVVLVPGMAFDASGNRLGRGKGYYDRFLKYYPNAYTIGVAYREQCVDKVIVQAHDIPMKEVIFI